MEKMNVCRHSAKHTYFFASSVLALATAFLVCLLLSLSACGGDTVGVVGDSCTADGDCSDFCLLDLEGEWQGEPQRINFPDGMCSADCENPGEWDGFDICLLYAPTGEHYAFPGCRNQDDCRSGDGYICTLIGYDLEYQPAKACLPPDAL